MNHKSNIGQNCQIFGFAETEISISVKCYSKTVLEMHPVTRLISVALQNLLKVIIVLELLLHESGAVHGAQVAAKLGRDVPPVHRC